MSGLVRAALGWIRERRSLVIRANAGIQARARTSQSLDPRVRADDRAGGGVEAWRVRPRALRAAILACLALFGVGVARAEGGLETLTIATSTGAHAFQVEIAKDEASREKGLMYRRFMPADRGMLFEFDVDQPVSFWMKNTYIPLDMIFIGPDGSVVGVAANAEPLSEAIVPSGAPCIAVLELNGGAAAKIGLKPGDKVKASFFKN